MASITTPSTQMSATSAPATATGAAFEARKRFVSRVELLHVVFGLAGFATAFAMAAEPVWIGVGSGAAVALANFHAMAGLLQRLTTGDMQARSLAVGLLMLKLLLLGGAVLAILTLLEADPVGFAVGLSVTPVSLLIVSFFSAGGLGSAATDSGNSGAQRARGSSEAAASEVQG